MTIPEDGLECCIFAKKKFSETAWNVNLVLQEKKWNELDVNLLNVGGFDNSHRRPDKSWPIERESAKMAIN